MSLGITSAGASHLLDLLRAADTPSGSYYVALICKIPPGYTIGGEELDEPDYPEYARGVLVNDSASWDISESVMTNLQEVTFPVSLNEWGQINYIAICDQPLEIGGRVLFCGEVDEQLYVEANQQVVFGPGEIGISVGGVQWLNAAMP